MPHVLANSDGLNLGSFVYGGGLIIDILPWIPSSWPKESRFGLRLQGGVLVPLLDKKDARFSGIYPHFGFGFFVDIFQQKRDID